MSELTAQDGRELLPLKDSYTEAEATLAARQYSHLRPYLLRCETILTTYAREHGGFVYGGEDCNGKQVGAIYVDERRSVYEQYPLPEYVADALTWILAPRDLDPEELYRFRELIHLQLEKIPMMFEY